MLTTQQLKDTFYATLQTRIALLNPSRTIVIRGQLRPAILVVENELPGASIDGIAPAETFCLRWTSIQVDTNAAGPLVTLGCEIRYASDGTLAAAGLDRGRALAAMDAELLTSASERPMSAPTFTLAEIPGGGASSSTLTGSSIFWSQPTFNPTVARGERLERTAHLEVFGYAH